MASNQKRILQYLLGRLDDLLLQDDEFSFPAKAQVLADLEELDDPESLVRLREILQDRDLKMSHQTREAVKHTATVLYLRHRDEIEE
ncbi:MAG: hypothetical protein MUF38_08615 [Anaerolineae bacterium]|jgi:hypothetical protein|nr:hypothetical protein [Anaerolineae bacterium]